MKNTEEQKIKIKQQEARLAAIKIKLKIKEDKLKTKQLIEFGHLIIKAKLNALPSNTLYGALLSIKEKINNADADTNKNIEEWNQLAKTATEKETQNRSAIIIKFEYNNITKEILSHIKSHGLRWNSLRKEWYGYVTDLDSLKTNLEQTKYTLEIIEE